MFGHPTDAGVYTSEGIIQEGQSRQAAASFIGQPIRFVSGQYAGQTMRAEMHEVQKADLGRKYARVDRRPLDPPPVVMLKLFHVYNEGTDKYTEQEVENYDDVQSIGFLCTVDLFPVPSPDSASWRNHGPTTPQYPIAGASVSNTEDKGRSFTFVASQPYPGGPDQPVPTSPLQLTHQPVPGYQSPTVDETNVIHRVNEYPIHESSKMTGALVGATFVQPVNVDYQGKKVLMFVFADLAVKTEGHYILRYRIFDIFSRPLGQEDLAIQAECYGGIFRVYSTKDFPGLRASTELTKLLSRWGVRLNIRETERKRRKKTDRKSVSPTGGRLDKHRQSDSE